METDVLQNSESSSSAFDPLVKYRRHFVAGMDFQTEVQQKKPTFL